MMNEKLFKDIKNSKQVAIIGVSVIASSELKAELEQTLLIDLQEGKKKCVVIGESDNQLFQQSLLTDTDKVKPRISFEELIIRRKFFFDEFDRSVEKIKNSNVRISALTLPFHAIQTDKTIWYLPINDFNVDNYFPIKEGDKLFDSVINQINLLSNDINDKERENRFLSKPGKELLELFDQNKIPRGIFPRDSFYNTDHYQYVVWGLVFNREGKLLIHKRAKNAKDNQDMWDKSVGGHIDFQFEKSTHEAIMREMIEELFTKEQERQSGHTFSMLTDDKSKIHFLGDWRLENYGTDYLNHIKVIENKTKKGEENWVVYQYPLNFTHNTPRAIPKEDGGGEKWLRVVVDVFFIIANTGVTQEYIDKEFKNSVYLLIEPNKLKSWMENGIADDYKYNGENNEFKVTHDLKFIMTGKLRDIIAEVSTTIKYSNIRK
jgi:hypothetical protein